MTANTVDNYLTDLLTAQSIWRRLGCTTTPLER